MAQPVPTHPVAVTPDFWTQMQLLLVNGGLHLLEALVILILGWSLATWVKRWLDEGLARLPLDATLKPLLSSLIRYAILLLTFVLVLGQFGFQTTSLIAVLGAAGLAVGLAMQGTLSNVAAGVMLLILRPFRVSHYVQAGGQEGVVREIGLFTILLITRDGIYVSLPNAAVFGATIINYTRERTRRIKFTVPVDVANDLDKVEKAIVEALTAHPLVLKEPPPSAVVQQLQEYTVLMTARAIVRSADYWKALYALQKDVKAALDKAGILYAVTRQAVAVRNERLSDANRPVEDDVEPETELAPMPPSSPLAR